jgi:Protein of unknown function (DUF1653)
VLLPMREKYVDEALDGPWHVNGVRLSDCLTATVSGASRDVFLDLPADAAEKVLALEQAFRRQLYAVLCGRDQAAAEPRVGTLWRHRKGGTYRVEGLAKDEATGEVLVLYRTTARGGGLAWARPAADFMDGRFEEVPPPSHILVGVDGNCGFAVYGANLQEGEAEFVQVRDGFGSLQERQRRACGYALQILRDRLGIASVPCVLHESHPDGPKPEGTA